jgi:hypothetical protein
MSDPRQEKEKDKDKPDCEITGYSSTRLGRLPRSSDSAISFLYRPHTPGNNEARGRRSIEASKKRVIKSELLRELRRKRFALAQKEEQVKEESEVQVPAEVPATPAPAGKQESAEVPAALAYPRLLDKVLALKTCQDFDHVLAELDRVDREPKLTCEQLDVLNEAATRTIRELDRVRELKVECKEDVDDDVGGRGEKENRGVGDCGSRRDGECRAAASSSGDHAASDSGSIAASDGADWSPDECGDRCSDGTRGDEGGVGGEPANCDARSGHADAGEAFKTEGA